MSFFHSPAALSPSSLSHNIMQKILNPKQFILGGKAHFGLNSVASGVQHQYTVLFDGSRFGVQYQTETIGYFIGEHLYLTGAIQLGRGTGKELEAAKGLQWFWNRVIDGSFIKYSDRFFAYHIGKCAMCARPLTDEESVIRGIGPVCWKRLTS